MADRSRFDWPRVLGMFSGALLLLAGTQALAAESGNPQAAAREKQDAVCTVCHNEGWRTPVLSIYQTKMGVKGDPRTPRSEERRVGKECRL